MMSLILFSFLVSETPAPSGIEIREKVVFKKESEFDLEGSEVEAEVRLPYEFFQIQAVQPESRNLLEDRLNLNFRNLNKLAY